MYFPIGWPKSVNLALPNESKNIKHVCFDAVKILLAAIGCDMLGIWYANPLVPIVHHSRSFESLITYGENKLLVWKPDSRQLIVLTTEGALILYQVNFDTGGNGIFLQMDSPFASLKRDSAELFIKENIPKIILKEMCVVQLNSFVTSVCCISLSELIVATRMCELLRLQWSDLEADALGKATTVASAINLHEVQFYVNQRCNLKTIPPVNPESYVAALEYSPFIGGCAAVFSDKRAAFLIANHLKFESTNMHAFWIPEVVDATACSVNHKFRIISFGRSNSDVSLYAIEDTTGGLEFSHGLSLSTNVLPGTLGSVCELKWSPDGCVLAVAWENGGIALWSTFGFLLMSSFSWDFGIHIDLVHDNPLRVSKMEWSTEGYQLYLTCNMKKADEAINQKPYSNVYQIYFVKSALTMNPCMTAHPHVLLQETKVEACIMPFYPFKIKLTTGGNSFKKVMEIRKTPTMSYTGNDNFGIQHVESGGEYGIESDDGVIGLVPYGFHSDSDDSYALPTKTKTRKKRVQVENAAWFLAKNRMRRENGNGDLPYE